MFFRFTNKTQKEILLFIIVILIQYQIIQFHFLPESYQTITNSERKFTDKSQQRRNRTCPRGNFRIENQVSLKDGRESTSINCWKIKVPVTNRKGQKSVKTALPPLLFYCANYGLLQIDSLVGLWSDPEIALESLDTPINKFRFPSFPLKWVSLVSVDHNFSHYYPNFKTVSWHANNLKKNYPITEVNYVPTMTLFATLCIHEHGKFSTTSCCFLPVTRTIRIRGRRRWSSSTHRHRNLAEQQKKRLMVGNLGKTKNVKLLLNNLPPFADCGE